MINIKNIVCIGMYDDIGNACKNITSAGFNNVYYHICDGHSIYRNIKTVMEMSYSKGFDNVLLFEDDVKFYDNFQEQYQMCLEELSTLDWGIYLLGGNLMRVDTIEDEHNSLYRINSSLCTHAMLINRPVLEYIHENINYNMPFDLNLLKNVFPKFNIYHSKELIVTQSRKHEKTIKTHYNRAIKFFEDKKAII